MSKHKRKRPQCLAVDGDRPGSECTRRRGHTKRHRDRHGIRWSDGGPGGPVRALFPTVSAPAGGVTFPNPSSSEGVNAAAAFAMDREGVVTVADGLASHDALARLVADPTSTDTERRRAADAETARRIAEQLRTPPARTPLATAASMREGIERAMQQLHVARPVSGSLPAEEPDPVPVTRMTARAAALLALPAWCARPSTPPPDVVPPPGDSRLWWPAEQADQLPPEMHVDVITTRPAPLATWTGEPGAAESLPSLDAVRLVEGWRPIWFLRRASRHGDRDAVVVDAAPVPAVPVTVWSHAWSGDWDGAPPVSLDAMAAVMADGEAVVPAARAEDLEPPPYGADLGRPWQTNAITYRITDPELHALEQEMARTMRVPSSFVDAALAEESTPAEEPGWIAAAHGARCPARSSLVCAMSCERRERCEGESLAELHPPGTPWGPAADEEATTATGVRRGCDRCPFATGCTGDVCAATATGPPAVVGPDGIADPAGRWHIGADIGPDPGRDVTVPHHTGRPDPSSPGPVILGPRDNAGQLRLDPTPAPLEVRRPAPGAVHVLQERTGRVWAAPAGTPLEVGPDGLAGPWQEIGTAGPEAFTMGPATVGTPWWAGFEAGDVRWPAGRSVTVTLHGVDRRLIDLAAGIDTDARRRRGARLPARIARAHRQARRTHRPARVSPGWWQ